MLRADSHTPNIASEVEVTEGDASYPVLVMTPLGEPLGCSGVRLPIHAFCPIVDTLRYSHELGLCHIDVCGENMFAVKRSACEYDIILNDWASSMLTSDVDAAEMFSTHELYYDLTRKMGPEQDLAALVRAVFVLTQCTFSPAVKNARELDDVMRSQWSWGLALDRARARDYDSLARFFRTGSCEDASEGVQSGRAVKRAIG